ncbi:8638_t:CDS:2 [Gigaspora margarita]|uniref:8638_t:CDS:1 n=1 Tax=Gigaspora margarita TaxID=4874 RepID=A0ABN7UMZ4_GIGMA|nr:8638_t:CDS:2 [Gigaspora margarita]
MIVEDNPTAPSAMSAILRFVHLSLTNYQVNNPTQDVFWNPPVIRGAPSTVGYAITVPGSSLLLTSL